MATSVSRNDPEILSKENLTSLYRNDNNNDASYKKTLLSTKEILEYNSELKQSMYAACSTHDELCVPRVDGSCTSADCSRSSLAEGQSRLSDPGMLTLSAVASGGVTDAIFGERIWFGNNNSLSSITVVVEFDGFWSLMAFICASAPAVLEVKPTVTF